MAESLLSSIAKSVLGKIASPALQGALRETLTAIQAVLSDVEAQQAKNNRLQDVLDELECEALRKQVTSRFGGIKGKVHRFFSLSNPLIFREKISHKIQEIRERLSRITTEKDQFNLNVRSADNGVAHTRSREMTYLFINKLDVIGRDIDKEKIIKMLMQSDDKNLSVFPIVGIRGIGKTTLAKLVYNDDRVKDQFELRLWVCVPEDFDLKKTIEGIIKDAIRQNLSNFNIQQLQNFLQDIIKDKKFLLVLDDVWSSDRGRWEEFRDLLTGGASESKIIVTTRIGEVASIMGTHPVYNLKGLSPEESMALFRKWAFDKKEKELRPDLLGFGNDIVKKSQGVPLLVKTLGSLLYSKDDDRHWKHIRDSETWELMEAKKDIVPVLKLSYNHLPSHLKHCFATFSLFARGAEMKGLSLARLWMALGLINVGIEYIKELWKRSMIQEVEECGAVLAFKVHDLVHSLATRIRCISFSSISLEGISNFDGVPPFLRKPTSKRLHAIMFQYKEDGGVITREFAGTCILKCNHIRYLDLSYSSFVELPSSIYNLKQLRSLCLNANKQLKKLPGTICELQSLLQLSLDRRTELGDLPKNMDRLVTLRFLYITTKQKSLQESGIQYLENLQFLGLKACENLHVLFEGTCRLTCLRELEIVDCEGPIFLPFGELKALESLAIGNSKLELTLENKDPIPYYLKELCIEHCGELSKRCEPQTGKDWNKITHVPRIQLDLVDLQWMDD
ncbi:hypothetical protein BT93_H2959 [Corymbia citriodora subsp. variegata]|nr:hypothetical protein BT93_H2959 [Corymbia citriodora subsp. variegata]